MNQGTEADFLTKSHLETCPSGVWPKSGHIQCHSVWWVMLEHGGTYLYPTLGRLRWEVCKLGASLDYTERPSHKYSKDELEWFGNGKEAWMTPLREHSCPTLSYWSTCQQQMECKEKSTRVYGSRVQEAGYAYPPDVKVQSHHSQAECSSHQDCPWLRMELTVGLGRRLSGLSSTKAKTRVWSKYMYVSFYSFFGIQDILCYWKTLILYDDLFLMKIQRQLETLGFHLFNMTTFVMLDECVFAVILCRIFVGQHEVHVLTVGVLDSCFPQNRALSLKWVSLESSSFLLYNFLFSNFYFWYYIYLHYFPLPFSSQCTPLLCFKFKFMASFSFVVDRYIDVDIDICLCIHIYIHIFLHTQVQPAQSI